MSNKLVKILKRVEVAFYIIGKWVGIDFSRRRLIPMVQLLQSIITIFFDWLFKKFTMSSVL